jgi:nitroreductase
MDLFKAIEKRHSYRGAYKEEPVLKEDLIKILEAGLKAPSGKNQQTTEFIIVDAPELVGKIAVLHELNKAVQQAKAFIVCIVDKEPEPIYGPFSFQLEDCSAAVENMLLAVTALGYATVWIDGWLRVENRAEKIGSLLNLPETKRVQILLPIGVPVDIKSQPKKKSLDERVWFNRYTTISN